MLTMSWMATSCRPNIEILSHEQRCERGGPAHPNAFELQHNQIDCVQIIEVQCLTLRTFVKIPSVPIKEFSDVLGFDIFLSISLMSSAKVGIRVNLCFALITSAVFAIY